MGNYTEYSIITRQMAWRDLKEDFTRFKNTDRELHIVTDVHVNLVRIVVGERFSRDVTQTIGRVFMGFNALVIVGVLLKLFT